MSKISVEKLHSILDQGRMDGAVLIDVRSPGEYRAGTIPGAVNMPLDEIEEHFDELKGYEKVYVHCQSGNRSGRACQALHALEGPEIVDVEGGLTAWDEAGYRVQRSKRAGISIMRQVHIGASTLGLIGLTLGFFVTPLMYLLTVFVFLGLMVSGLTGFCGMATLLAKAPWNK